MTLAFIFIILFALILIICLTIIEDKIKVKQNKELEKNIKLMEVTNGSDVFKIANPSTLYLTCYMKHGEILKNL